MDRLTITQRIEIIKIYYKNGDSATTTYRALRGDYDLHNRATRQAIGKIVKKFEDNTNNNMSVLKFSFYCQSLFVALLRLLY